MIPMNTMNTMKTTNKHCFIFTIKISYEYNDSYEYYENYEYYE